MICVKKYFQFLVVIGLCLNVTNNRAGEFSYDIPIPGSGEIVEVGKNFGGMVKEVFRENPRLAAVLLLPIMAVPLIMGRGKIAGLAEGRCKKLEEEIKKECKDGLKQVGETSWMKRYLLYVLKPLVGGFQEYFKYNKLHMGAAAVFVCLGQFAGHPYIGAAFSSLSLIKGWLSQAIAGLHNRFDDTDKAIADLKAENAQLHSETQEKVDAIKKSVESLSKQLDTTGTAIQKQMSGLEIKVSNDIKKVGQNLTELDAKLKDVPKQILKMTEDLQAAQEHLQGIQGSNATIMQQNNAIVEQTKALSQQLTVATQKFVSTKEQFDKLGETLTAQVKKLAEDTQRQINIIQDHTGKQTEEMRQLRSNMGDKFQELFEEIAANNLLMQSFRTIQESQDAQLTQLLDKINDTEKCGIQTLDLVNGLIAAQKQSADRYNILAGSLDKIQTTSMESTNAIIDKIKNIEIALEEKINTTRKEVSALAVKLEVGERERREGHKELMTEIINNREVTDRFEQKFNDCNIRQEKQHEELKSAFDKLQRESEQKQLELYRVIHNLNLRLDGAYQILNRKIDQNLELTRETNLIAKDYSNRFENLPIAYPLSVPISGYGQDEQIFPLGKKILNEPQQGRKPMGAMQLLGKG